VIDCGTHTEVGNFGTKTVRKIKVSWELPESTHVFKEGRGPEPFSVHQSYTFSVHEKSNLRKDLESWRGKKFTPEELDNFELFNLVGKPCLINVVHNNSQGRIYANVSTIAPVPNAMKGNVPALHNPEVRYEFGMGRDATFSKLPQFMQEYISKCAEWNGGDKSGSGSGTVADGLDDDDIPF
jgi:hypothetical protein